MAVVLALVLLKAEISAGWPPWLHAVVVLGVGLAVAAGVQLYLVPRLRARVLSAGHVGEVCLSTGLFHIMQLAPTACPAKEGSGVEQLSTDTLSCASLRQTMHTVWRPYPW